MEEIRMMKIATFALLACIIAVLSGCSAYPITDEEKQRQAQAEEQRRKDALNRGR
jgi:PBP1b-binding outer membrane lipoprotein LpoB